MVLMVFRGWLLGIQDGRLGTSIFNGNIAGNPDRYLDYITDYDANGVVAAYKCVVSHTSAISNKPGTAGGNAYWESISYVPVIASDLVLAKSGCSWRLCILSSI